MAFNIVVITILLVVAAVGLLSFFQFRRLKRQVNFMFDAIGCGDFAFRYSTRGVMNTRKGINKQLNKLIAQLGRMADEQRQREQYYEVLMECVDTGVIVADERGFVVEANKAACRMLHRDVITHLDQLSDIDKQSFAIDTTPITLRSKPLRIITVKDISQQLYAKEQESWERITHVLTHEIMNSITPITSLCDTMMKNSPEGDDTLRKGLSTISRTGRGLMDFVEHYRQYANVPKPNATLFYLKPFLEEMRNLALQYSIQKGNPAEITKHQIEITLKVEPADAILHADESLISRVVINLLRNAIQAFDSHQELPQIDIRAFIRKDETTVIDITNNGPDIDVETAKQIFIPFFTTRPDGSGIGLPLSRRIMRLSGGDLQLIADRKHHLTTFRLFFP